MHIQSLCPRSSRKKENTAERLNDMRGEAAQLGEEIVAKRQQASSFAGETVLK